MKIVYLPSSDNAQRWLLQINPKLHHGTRKAGNLGADFGAAVAEREQERKINRRRKKRRPRTREENANTSSKRYQVQGILCALRPQEGRSR